MRILILKEEFEICLEIMGRLTIEELRHYAAFCTIAEAQLARGEDSAQVVMGCLSKDPAYQIKAVELGDELERINQKVIRANDEVNQLHQERN